MEKNIGKDSLVLFHQITTLVCLPGGLVFKSLPGLHGGLTEFITSRYLCEEGNGLLACCCFLSINKAA